MANEWLDSMLQNKISKEAMESQGTDKQDHFERKVQAHDWIKGVSDLDPVAVEAEYQAKLKQEAMILGKTAALDDVIADGTTPEEVVNRDYKRDVISLSDYALAELLAEARGHKAQNTSEMFYELKEKAKAEVASSRDKAEKALLEMIPDNTQLDWQKAFKQFTKDATPAEAKEKDLFRSDVPEKEHDFQHPTEEKFKLPKDAEKAIPGNGREADERKEVTQEAGVLQADIVAGTSKEASLKDEHRPGAGKTECKYCGEKKCDYSCDESQAGGFSKKEAEKANDGKCFQCEKDSKTSPCVDCKELNKKNDYEEKHGRGSYKGAAMAPDSIEDLASVEKDAAPNMSVIESFISGSGGMGSANLHIVKGTKGMVLVNYETPIAYRSADGELFLNSDKYSVTTSKIQNFIRQAAGGQLKEVSAGELETIMQGKPGIVPNAEAPTAAPATEPVAAQAPAVEKVADANGCPVCGSIGNDLGNGTKENMSCEGCGITYASASLAPKADLETDGIMSPEEIAETFINGNISDAREAIGNDISTFVKVLEILGGGPEADSFKRLMSKHASREIKNAATKSQVIQKVAELKKIAEVPSPWEVTTDEQGNEVIARVDHTVTNTKESEEDKTEDLQK